MEDTESPGINTLFYCFERQVAAFKCRSSIVIEDGDYSVTANIVQPYGAWCNQEIIRLKRFPHPKEDA
jgi:hypothetical protein